MHALSKSALLPYSAHEMYALVSDIAAYGEFLPWCGGARVMTHDEDEVVAAIDIVYSGVHRTFTTRNRLQKDKMMELVLVDGPFSHLHGFWRFQALGEQASKISLDLEFKFSNRMLGLAIGPMFNSMAGGMVDAFRRRAVELYGER